MDHPARVLVTAFVVAVLSLAGWHWRDAWWPWRDRPTGEPAAAAPAASAPADAASVAAGPPPVLHPIDAASAPPLPEPAPATLDAALIGAFGREALSALVLRDDFARRVVVMVDGLGREKSPARLWPLAPPPGRFTTVRQGDAEAIATPNFVRYSRHLALVEQVDLGFAVALYKRFYPQFQKAYEDLGYPGRHFNDRLVEVIDLLLATPVPAGPVQVQRPDVQGPIKPERPWLMYEYADRARQAMPAGPQLLLRMGPENQRRAQARLRELRRMLTRP